MMQHALATLMQENSEGAMSLPIILETMGHATAVGSLLVLATYLSGNYLARAVLGEQISSKENLKEIIGASNLLFLTVGLCGIMLLINNSIFRAFAIVAAIALVRFRVKLDNKALTSSFLFAILAGMACGVKEIAIAWSVVGLYIALVGLLLIIVNLVRKYTGPVAASASPFSPGPTVRASSATMNQEPSAL